MVWFSDLVDQFDKVGSHQGFQVIFSDTVERAQNRDLAQGMKISVAREGKQQVTVEKEVELAGKRAPWPERTLRHRSEFSVAIREPSDDQARIRVPVAPEQYPIQ